MTSTSRRAHRHHSDDGFSIIEIVVAAGVLFVALVVMAHSAVVALVDVGHSRQRQSATGLANQALEQLRALPSVVVRQGLATTDLETTDDPRITEVDGAYFYDGEKIVLHTPAVADAVRPPLVPHTQSLTVGPTTYEVAAYVTVTADDQTLRATVEVSWADQALRQGTSGNVVTQTLLSGAVGCGDSSAENPYPAPCAADLKTTATVGKAAIVIEAAPGLDPDFSDFEFATLDLTSLESWISVGQVDVVHSQAVTSGVTLQLTDNPLKLTGAKDATADVSSDTGDDDTDKVDPVQASETFSTTSTKNAVRVTSSASDEATAVSTVQARAAVPCVDEGGFAEEDGRPCGRADAWQKGLMNAELRFPDAAIGIEPIIRARAEVAPDSNVFTDRTVNEPPKTTCTLQGCVHSHAQRRITDIELGMVPVDLISDGFTSLVRVEDVDVVATAEVGEGAVAPGVTTKGKVSYWDPSINGYRTEEVGEDAKSITTSYDTTTGIDKVSMQGSFTIGGTEIVDPGEVCDSSCHTSATATGRILHGSYTYTVVDASGDTVADLRINVNLGTVQATASYTRPPNAF